VVLDNVVDLLVVNKFEYCLFGEAILARLVAEWLLIFFFWLVFIHLWLIVVASILVYLRFNVVASVLVDLWLIVVASVLVKRGTSCVVNLELFYRALRAEVILNNRRNVCFGRTWGFLGRNHFTEILIPRAHNNKRRVVALTFLSRHWRLVLLKQSTLVLDRCEFLASLRGNLRLMLGHTVFLAFIIFLDWI